MKINKYVAELIASFTLTFAVSISIISGTPMATPLVAALVVGIFVYTIGPISGAHISPAVTVGLLSVKKINLRDAAVYIISQIVGAVLAMIVVQGATEGAVDVAAVDSMQSFLAEGLGTFILVFGISSVVFGKVSDSASGLVIGGSLLAGLMVTGGMSNAVLNPAVAIALGSVSMAYIVAPVVGAIIAAFVYRKISQ